MPEEKKFPAPDEETEMASPEEMEAALDEETPPRGEATGGTETLAEERLEEEEATPIPQTGINVGGLRDRVAGGFIDLLLLAYLYAGALFVYNYFASGEMLRPIPTGTWGLVFHSIVGFLGFLYFFIFEGVFYTTPGKIFARLSVRDTTGRPASLLAIALRNILRPLDTLLCFFPTWILWEKLSNKQRLGDWLAGTVVMKHYTKMPTRLPVTGYTASATARLLAGLLDLALSLLWIGGILLSFDHEKPFLSLILIGLLPVFYLAWHLMWEGFFQTTFGLWIFGLRIVGEDGSPIGFSQAILRALFRLFDSNPVGWMTLYLSHKNQRPSDLAAATVVVHAKRRWNALLGLGISLALIGSVWIAGFSNPRSFLTPFFKADFLKQIFSIRVGGLAGMEGPSSTGRKGLFIKQLTFLEQNRTTPRENETFKPGEQVVFSFEMAGFTVRDNEAWIQEDLIVRYPDHSIGFKQENTVDFHQSLKKPEQALEILNTLSLPLDAKPGNYTLVLVLHDRLSDRHLTEQRTFRVAP